MSIDKEILRKMLDRNEDGLSLLYQHYSASLFGIGYRVLNNSAFAEDALQASFLKIWNNIDKFDEKKSTLFTWMSRIVRNTAIDIKRLKSFQLEEKSDTLIPTVHNTKSEYINTNKMDAETMMNSLDDKYAFVIEYLYLKGYSQSELSKEFDIPLGTIKTRLKKGIGLLRKEYYQRRTNNNDKT